MRPANPAGVSRRLVLIGLAAVSIATAGCRTSTSECPASVEDARHDLIGLQAAAVWWWQGLDPSRKASWLFASLEGKDAGPELLTRLQQQHGLHERYRALEPWIVPYSMATVDENGVAHHRENGEQGLTLWVGNVEFSSPTSAKARVEHAGCGDLCGGSDEVFLLCDESGCRVYDAGTSLAY